MHIPPPEKKYEAPAMTELELVHQMLISTSSSATIEEFNPEEDDTPFLMFNF